MRRFLLLMALAFLAQAPDLITAIRKGSKLCEYIEITSKTGIVTKYPSYLGVYKRQDAVNGKLMYLKSNDIAMWWSNSAESWKIGNKKYVGSNIGNIYNAKDICKGGLVDLLHDKCGSWWRYWNDDDWVYDTTIKVKCFEDEKNYTMENNKYCGFPEDEDGIQMHYQDVTRYEDLGNVTRACNEANLEWVQCTTFYYSILAKAYFICPEGSEIREKKGYQVFQLIQKEDD